MILGRAATTWDSSCSETLRTCRAQAPCRARARCSSWERCPAWWGAYFSGEAGSEAFGVEGVGLDEGGEIVGVGRGHDVERVLFEVQVRLLAITKG
jgi:hypothetical protein